MTTAQPSLPAGIQSRRVAGLTAAERRRLLGWGTDIFGGFSANLGHLVYRRKPLVWVAYAGADAVCRVCADLWTCGLNGRDTTVIGLGGIVTVPEYQRRGLAAKLMVEVLDYGADQGAEAGLLLCLPARHGYYQRRGWRDVARLTYLEQPSGDIVNPFYTMIWPLREQAWPVEDLDLRSRPW